MAGTVSWTFADFEGEKSTFKMHVPTLTAANIDAVKLAITNFATNIAAVTNGLEVKYQLMAEVTGSGSGYASDGTANRELKWLLRYSDNVTGKVYTAELPCPDLSATLRSQSDGAANLADGTVWGGAANLFKENFEIAFISPEGNAVTLISARIVGRNI